jgi:hypothetical protein
MKPARTSRRLDGVHNDDVFFLCGCKGGRTMIQAERIGVFVPEGSWRGKVVSLYKQAINIWLEGKGLLLSLVETEDHLTSLGIQSALLFAKDRTTGGRGDRAGGRDERVCGLGRALVAGATACRLDDILVIGKVLVDLSGATTWVGTLSYPDIQGFTPGRVGMLEKGLRVCGKMGGLLGLHAPRRRHNPVEARASHAVRPLSLTVKPPGRHGLPCLVGLGPGFTPSGDDFLCGVLLGERIVSLLGTNTLDRKRRSRREMVCQEPEWQEMSVSPSARAEIADRLGQTTVGGRTLLWQALQGHFPWYLLEAVRGISTAANEECMLTVVARACDHGETSGTDALTGLLWFLKTFIRKRGGDCGSVGGIAVPLDNTSSEPV